MVIESQDTSRFDVDPHGGFTPLCPDERLGAGSSELEVA